jgi:hypothetical protein
VIADLTVTLTVYFVLMLTAAFVAVTLWPPRR